MAAARVDAHRAGAQATASNSHHNRGMSTTAPLHPFKSITYRGTAPGPRLIITGAVHGNEVCGTWPPAS